MNLTFEQINAICKLYTNVVRTVGNTAYDAEGNEVAYDITAVNDKLAEDEANELAAEQAQATAKASALAKLAALGLTQDEVKALVG